MCFPSNCAHQIAFRNLYCLAYYFDLGAKLQQSTLIIDLCAVFSQHDMVPVHNLNSGRALANMSDTFQSFLVSLTLITFDFP